MEEVVSSSMLHKGETRVVAVQVIDVNRGTEMVKSLLVPVLEPIEHLARRVQAAVNTEEEVTVFNNLVPTRGDMLVRLLNLKHHDRLLCSVGPVKHAARCMRCKQAPIIGTRHHVSGYSVDLCPKHAEEAPASIRQLLKPLHTPHMVHDGIVSTHGCPTRYTDAYTWLCSVDGPYTSKAQVDEAVKEGADLFINDDGHMIWTWPRDAEGLLKTGCWPLHCKTDLLHRHGV